MKTSEFFQEKQRRITSSVFSTQGFTLLEILVVLFIVGLTSAVVLPRLPLVADSLDFALKRQSFEQNLSGLAYQAYTNGQNFILSGHYTSLGPKPGQRGLRPPRRSLRSDLRTMPTSDESREFMPPVITADVTPVVPDGWELIVPKPIYFRGSGFCTGGYAELVIGRLRYDYVLDTPSCKANLVD
ncbi:MAG TPA: hypothetical protein DGZ24_07660 [Rhodospirillaceae bacterium]|nr:hypothetical protein [Candidatus Neomarinimicrobiota bacterium]HCX15176.1 hypothetical protein [Rhodospirillaceae bacterium]